MIYQSYNLNLVPDKVPLSVWCSQFDADSRTFLFTIYDGSTLYEIPSGSTVTCRGTKPDNTGFEYACTFADSVVSVILKDQMSVINGKVPCEIRITNSGEIVGTANFNLMVEKTPLDPEVTISDTYLPLLEDAEQNAIRAESAASQAVSVLSSAVKSVNNTLPDANGNVNVSTGAGLPSGGTTGQVLTKLSNADDDADWESIPSDATKMNLVSSPTNGDLLTTNSSGQAIDSGTTIAQLKCLVITSSSFSSLPQTISNANVTANHVVINSVLSNPSAQTGDWTITTSSGSLTISGSISGSTTLTLYLIEQR